MRKSPQFQIMQPQYQDSSRVAARWPARYLFVILLNYSCKVLAEHPLDTIKIRMQSQDASLARLRNPLQVFKHVTKHEGFSTLFQGLIPRLATYGLVKLSLFTLYEKFFTITQNAALAGSCAGMCNTLVSCPPDLIKCRLQMQNRQLLGRNSRSLAIFNHARELWSFKRSISGLYVGWRALLVSQFFVSCRSCPQVSLQSKQIRDLFGYAALFWIYDTGRRSGTLPMWAVGGLAGVSFYLTSLPADRVKTILMTQVRPAENASY